MDLTSQIVHITSKKCDDIYHIFDSKTITLKFDWFDLQI